MNEDIKGMLITIVVIILVILGAIRFLTEYNKKEQEQHQKNIQEINECLEKTSDVDWCLNKFLE